MKNILSRISLSTGVLGVIAVVLAALVVLRLVHGTEAGELLATPPKAPNLPQMKLDAPTLEAHFEPVRDHALFYASRAFYVAPPPPAAPTAPPHPNYVLAGTFAIPHKHTVALLKQGANNTVLKVKAGDDLEGWHIESVESARVLLRYQDERFEIAGSTREPGSHLTRAPLTRSTPAGVAKATSALATSPDTTAPAASPTVRSLGDGRSGAPIRDAALRPGQTSIDARLYRPPPQ